MLELTTDAVKGGVKLDDSDKGTVRSGELGKDLTHDAGCHSGDGVLDLFDFVGKLEFTFPGFGDLFSVSEAMVSLMSCSLILLI